MKITAGALLVARKEISETIRKHLPNLTPMEVHRLGNQIYDGLDFDVTEAKDYGAVAEAWLKRNVPGFKN